MFDDLLGQFTDFQAQVLIADMMPKKNLKTRLEQAIERDAMHAIEEDHKRTQQGFLGDGEDEDDDLDGLILPTPEQLAAWDEKHYDEHMKAVGDGPVGS